MAEQEELQGYLEGILNEVWQLGLEHKRPYLTEKVKTVIDVMSSLGVLRKDGE